MKFDEVFKVQKPIIGMIHLKGNGDRDVLDRAMKEIGLYIRGGLNGIMIENYFGNYKDIVLVLEKLKTVNLDIPIGVNVLRGDAMAFELAKDYPVAFIQIDSVVGHLNKRDDVTFEEFLKLNRSRVDICLLGGVRFKYMPVVSENTVEDDLKIAVNRCDGICVTGDATGQETSLEKIKRFKDAVGGFPLIVAAGVNRDNIQNQLKYCDGAIVGSTFKDNRTDNGNVSLEHVEELMKIVKKFRRRIND